MVWAAFCYRGKTPMCHISTRIIAQMYLDLLDSELIKFGGNMYGDDWTFQQSNDQYTQLRSLNPSLQAEKYLFRTGT